MKNIFFYFLNIFVWRQESMKLEGLGFIVFLYLSIEGLDLINQRNEATFMCFRKWVSIVRIFEN